MRLSNLGWLTSLMVLQWKGFMAWLFLSEASESWYDDESNPWGFGCADRMVLAALLSSHISTLQWRQCSWVRQDSEMRCTWLQNQPGGNLPDYNFFLKNDLPMVMALSWKKKTHKLWVKIIHGLLTIYSEVIPGENNHNLYFYCPAQGLPQCRNSQTWVQRMNLFSLIWEARWGDAYNEGQRALS